jgi:putative polymerase
MTDDLKGRVGHTMYQLATLGSSVFTGGSLDKIYRTMDSGYAYVLMTQTLFGMLAFWIFTSTIVPPVNASNKRFNHGTALYIFLNLLIGAAIFSIKVSAPLWFLAGFLYHERYKTVEGPANVQR